MTWPWMWGSDGGGVFLLVFLVAVLVLGVRAWWVERDLDE